jgi:sulfite reductase (NADPH) hemoprotein beta-component
MSYSGSNFLRGTIAAGLQNTSTGALSESDTLLTKFHGIYQQDDRDLREERKLQVSMFHSNLLFV